MAGERVEYKGLPEFVAQCKVMDVRLVTEMETTGAEAARIVSTTAKGLTPHLTGRLAASIRQRGGNPATVGTSLGYARFVHFGSIHNPQPVPFLYDALEQRSDTVDALYDTRVAALMERVF